MFLHFNMHLILSFASSLLQRPLAIALCIYFNVRNRLQIDMANAISIARLILRCFLLMNSILSAVRTLQFKTGNHDQEWPESIRLSHLRWSWCLVMHTGGLIRLLTVGYWDQSGCRNSCLLLAQDLHKSGLFLLQISEATDELSDHMLMMVNLMILFPNVHQLGPFRVHHRKKKPASYARSCQGLFCELWRGARIESMFLGVKALGNLAMLLKQPFKPCMWFSSSLRSDMTFVCQNVVVHDSI